MHILIDSSTQFNTVGLHYQNHPLKSACQAGKHFVPFL